MKFITLLLTGFVAIWGDLMASASVVDTLKDLLDSNAIHVDKHKCPQGIPACTDEDLDTFEAALGGHKIPLQLRWFMKEYSQVSFKGRSVIKAQPHARDYFLPQINDAWKMGVPKDWLPFCNDNGDYYCVSFDTGQVKFWSSHEMAFSDSRDDEWSSFFDWIHKDWALLWD